MAARCNAMHALQLCIAVVRCCVCVHAHMRVRCAVCMRCLCLYTAERVLLLTLMYDVHVYVFLYPAIGLAILLNDDGHHTFKRDTSL